jgi:hypothetical protein
MKGMKAHCRALHDDVLRVEVQGVVNATAEGGIVDAHVICAVQDLYNSTTA